MFTSKEYSEAIQRLMAGLGQLKPDGNCCAICGDSGHQAWECHHNPLVIMRELETMRKLERQYAQRLGELARLSEIVCNWALAKTNMTDDVAEAASEILEYVEAVRP